VYVENKWRQESWPWAIKDPRVLSHLHFHSKDHPMILEDMTGVFEEIRTHQPYVAPSVKSVSQWLTDHTISDVKVGVGAEVRGTWHGLTRSVVPKLSARPRTYRRKMVGSMKRRAGHFMVWDDGTRSVTHLVFNDVNAWPLSTYGRKLLGKFVHYWSGREGSPNVKGTITAVGCERGLLVVSVKVR
jgi:hypothetical protein